MHLIICCEHDIFTIIQTYNISMNMVIIHGFIYRYIAIFVLSFMVQFFVSIPVKFETV